MSWFAVHAEIVGKGHFTEQCSSRTVSIRTRETLRNEDGFFRFLVLNIHRLYIDEFGVVFHNLLMDEQRLCIHNFI